MNKSIKSFFISLIFSLCIMLLITGILVVDINTKVTEAGGVILPSLPALSFDVDLSGMIVLIPAHLRLLVDGGIFIKNKWDELDDFFNIVENSREDSFGDAKLVTVENGLEV